jgi:hypothetical protein
MLRATTTANTAYCSAPLKCHPHRYIALHDVQVTNHKSSSLRDLPDVHVCSRITVYSTHPQSTPPPQMPQLVLQQTSPFCMPFRQMLGSIGVTVVEIVAMQGPTPPVSIHNRPLLSTSPVQQLL